MINSSEPGSEINFPVLRCLTLCKNTLHDINERTDAATRLLNYISKNPNYLQNDIIKSDLREIALQSTDPGIYASEYFFIKSAAFQCLKIVSNELENDFYKEYYRHVRARMIDNQQGSNDHPRYLSINRNIRYWSSRTIENLNEYVEICEKREKFCLLRTLSICLEEKNCLIDPSIFDDSLPSEWPKKLLICNLLSSDESDQNVAQMPQLITQIRKLDAFIMRNDTNHSIEKLLEILLYNRRKYNLDLSSIIHALKFMSSDIMILDIVTSNVERPLSIIIEELEISRLRELCDERNFVYANNREIVELRKLLIYSDEMKDSLLKKIASYTSINEISDFFKLLRHCDLKIEEKIHFLHDLEETSNSNSYMKEWKNVLFRELIAHIIRKTFPCYKFIENIEIDYKTYFSSVNKNFKNNTTYDELAVKKSSLHKNFKDFNEKIQLNALLSIYYVNIVKLAENHDWTMNIIRRIDTNVKSFDEWEKIVQLNDCLEILVEYELDITEVQIFDVISKSMASNVRSNIHDFVIESTFPKTRENDLGQLIDELKSLNVNTDISLLTNENNDLLNAYEDLMKAYNGKSSRFPDFPRIKKWNNSTFKDWINMTKNDEIYRAFNDMTCETARQCLDGLVFGKSSMTLGEMIRNKINENVSNNDAPSWPNDDGSLDNERLAIVIRACELDTGNTLRDVQLLSILLMLSCCDNDKGRLAQINTGEGKTLIIAIIAAYHALNKHKVDVITSSPQLAIPQSERQRSFFKKLGITVDHNIDNEAGYDATVLYGTCHQFQADVLRDEFRGNGTRHRRKFDIAIVDEVDNMLIDGTNHIVHLSTNMPGMDHLEPLLGAIYIQVTNSASSIIVKSDGRAYFVERGNSFDDDGRLKEKFDDQEFLIEGTKKDFIKSSTERHLRMLLRDGEFAKLSKDFPEIKIPRHLRDFICKIQLVRWIDRAISAKFEYVKDENYIIDGGKIKIVDANDTGVVQENSQWSNGLHQFLEIKHGAVINPECLTSNWMSNVSFFKRYRTNIYGLTGTLGNEPTRDFLSRTYGVDTIIVPPFRTKRYKELGAIVVSKEADWYNEIAKSCLRKLNNGRAVLIIMEYIRQTVELEKIFKSMFHYDANKIKMYKTDAESSVIEEALKPGEIVITTNIAGRGTDISLKDGIDENGGLHVCVTFLPKNSRVEQQNIGRTARTGNRGTSQFVVLRNSDNDDDIWEMRRKRFNEEEKKMGESDSEILRVLTEDLIFQRFSVLMGTIEGRNGTPKSWELTAVEERFAIWKEEYEDIMGKNQKYVLDEFEAFCKIIRNDDGEGKLIMNPYIHVKIGNNYLESENYVKAIEEYTLAIKLDPNFAENARYNRGYARIAAYGNDPTANEKQIDGSIRDFEKTRNLLDDRETGLHLLQTASDNQVFSDFVKHKLNLYNLQRNAIERAIGADHERIERDLEIMKEMKEAGKVESEEAKMQYKEIVKSLKKKKKVIGIIESSRSNEYEIQIERTKLEDSLHPDDFNSHKNEIREFVRNGYLGSFKISMRPPIDWWSVAGLLALGFGQLIIGVALMVFTAGGGGTFSTNLIAEGIKDIITAVRDGIINRDFSWATWAVEKVISIIVSVVSAGFIAMRDVARTAGEGVRGAASLIGGRALEQTTREGWKIVAKKVGLELSKGVAKEVTRTFIDYNVKKTLIPEIEEKIISIIEEPIQRSLRENKLVKKMLQLDEMNDNRFYEDRIIALGLEILSSTKNSILRELIKKMGHDIEVNEPSVAHDVFGLTKDLMTFVPLFIAELASSINKEAKRLKIDESTNVKITTDSSDEGKAGRPHQKDVSIRRYDTKPMDDDIDLDRVKDVDEKVKLKKKHRNPQRIGRVLTNDAASRMTAMIKEKLIDPNVKQGVDWSMEKITSSVDASMNNSVENFRDRWSEIRIAREQQ